MGVFCSLEVRGKKKIEKRIVKWSNRNLIKVSSCLFARKARRDYKRGNF